MKEEMRGMLKALLSKAHPEGVTSLLRFLPDEEKRGVEKMEISPTVDLSSLASPQKALEPIHYSWLFPLFESLPPQTQDLLFPLLSPAQAKGVTALSKRPFSPKPVSPLASTFLLNTLKNRVFEGNILPKELLPPSPLNPLVFLSKRELVHMIDLLGLHDLAADLRQVVDKQLINRIYKALTREQLQFLHFCAKQPMKWAPPKLNIAGWDGQRETLAALLHQRGVIRLSKALVNETPSLQWHITHKLDRGRGRAMMKLFAGKHDPDMIPYFRGQVLHLLTRYTS